MEKYLIYSRYEYWKIGPEKVFTEWSVCEDNEYDSAEADKRIKEIKSQFQDIDKKTKLKHEYKKVLIEN